MDDVEAASVQGSAQEPSIKSELPAPVEEPMLLIPLPPSAPSTARASPRRSITQAAPIPPSTLQSPPKYAKPSPTEIPDKDHRSPKSQSPKYVIPSPTEIPDKDYRSPKSQSPKYVIPSPTKMTDKEHRSPKSQSPKYAIPSPTEMPDKENRSPKAQRKTSGHLGNKIVNAVLELQPNDKIITEKVEGLKDTVKDLACEIVGSKSNNLTTNIDKIATMSKALTCEANALRQSIKCLTEDIARTKQELCCVCKEEDVNFPYHLFLIEIIINKIHMKCECFDIDFNNLVISAVFLGKPPIVLYDSSFGKIENFSKLNIGKSTLFAMTYDKICSIKEFVIVLLLTKQPPCTTCVTRIAETHMDFTCEFIKLREELCKKWMEEQPTDNILCTTSTPVSKNMYYLSCCDGENRDSIGVIEVTIRMSFLGKEITTAFCASPKPQGTSFLLKEDHGMTMYSCHKVEMDDQGKILLDEGVMTKKSPICTMDQHKRSESPQSQMSNAISRRSYDCTPVPCYEHAGLGEFRIRDLNDEINKLMREKRHWEVQIKSLGGPDHARVGPKMLDQDGKEVPGNRGYKYFGAAKDLPGVRELFEQEPPPPPRRTRADLMRDVDADYYGYRDDDDGLLMPLEQEAEKEAIAQAVDEWKRNKEQDKDQEVPEEEDIYPEDPDDKRIEEDEDGEPIRPIVTSHVAVPSQKDIEEALLRRKKQELLEKYGCMDVKMEPS